MGHAGAIVSGSSGTAALAEGGTRGRRSTSRARRRRGARRPDEGDPPGALTNRTSSFFHSRSFVSGRLRRDALDLLRRSLAELARPTEGTRGAARLGDQGGECVLADVVPPSRGERHLRDVGTLAHDGHAVVHPPSCLLTSSPTRHAVPRGLAGTRSNACRRPRRTGWRPQAGNSLFDRLDEGRRGIGELTVWDALRSSGVVDPSSGLGDRRRRCRSRMSRARASTRRCPAAVRTEHARRTSMTSRRPPARGDVFVAVLVGTKAVATRRRRSTRLSIIRSTFSTTPRPHQQLHIDPELGVVDLVMELEDGVRLDVWGRGGRGRAAGSVNGRRCGGGARPGPM